MDVKFSVGVSAHYTENTTRTTFVEGNRHRSQKWSKEMIMSLLDKCGKNAEILRRDVLNLETKRDVLLSTLDTLKDSKILLELNEVDREEVLIYSKLLYNRCLTVELEVNTIRDPTQEEALHQVNNLIDGLVINFRENPLAARIRCVSFMNACSSTENMESDMNFQTVILGCTLDDQKKVKKRLQGLLNYIDKSVHFC